MVQVRNIESYQPNGDSIQSARENCTLDFSQVMSGQSFRNDSRNDQRSSRAVDSIPNLEIVDYGRSSSSDTQQAARLSRVLHSGGLLQELDSAKTGKSDGKISKHDLDIYLRMHPENNPQTRAVQEIRNAWDDRHHPSHGAVKLLREELAHERKENRDGGVHVLGRHVPGLDRLPNIHPHRRDDSRQEDRQEPHSGRVERPETRPNARPEQRQDRAPECYEPKVKAETAKDLSEAGKVRPGEGYYQVAMRMIQTTGHKPSHRETMELVQALRTANNDRTVLTVQDNLSTLLDKQLPGKQGKVRDHLKTSH